MAHRHDWLEKLRFKNARWLGKYLTGIEAVRTTESEYVGRVDLNEEDFEVMLDKMGFSRNPLAYWKRVPGLGSEEGSWRWTQGDWQLHVNLFDGHEEQDAGNGYIYVFAHWEYRWDRYPLRHIRGFRQDDAEGVRRMRQMLEYAGVLYDTKIPPNTKWEDNRNI